MKKIVSIIIIFLTTLLMNPLYSFDNCNDGVTYNLNGEMNRVRNSWNKLIGKKNSSIKSFLKEINTFKNKNGIPILSFKEKSTPKNYIEYLEPPCGPLLITFQKTIKNTKTLGFDEVYEVSTKGNVIHSWLIPIESSILGVNENSLIVDYHISNLCGQQSLKGEFGLEIFTNGNMNIIEVQIQNLVLNNKDFSCKDNSLLKESGYRQCKLVNDKNNRERRFIFNAPCT
ncbi:MAG: hypothetical protein SFU98_13750 [Leptospiraceae bacterium]|nr:hypothetical protein [Leptospiraceae bacterium]